MKNGGKKKKTVKIDLHPMHRQLVAHVELLKASRDPKVLETIKKLESIEKQLAEIGCTQMGIETSFE